MSEIRLTPSQTPGPLAHRINSLLGAPELKRARTFAKLLDGFHLKNTVTSSVEGRRTVIDGREVINFGSANYLGLDCHPKVLEAARLALTDWGNHSGCSRIFSSHENIIDLETRLANLVGAEAAMVFPNTSSTHVGVVPTLFAMPHAVIVIDRFAHTSMFQAAQIAVAKGARLERTDVRDPNAVESQLKALGSSVRVLMIDGVYSMQGTVPDLVALKSICDRTNTILYIDDAHGLGVYGERGGGVVESHGLGFDNLILTSGLQKGLGSYGGFVAGEQALIDVLRVTSRSYIFSGTLQPQAVEGALAAISVCLSDEGRFLRNRLSSLSRHVRTELQNLGFAVRTGDSPIVSVLIGGELKTLLAGRKIFDEGSYVNSVLYPATPRDEGLLRISLNAIHTDAEIKELIRAFSELKTYLADYRSPTGPNLTYAREFVRRQLARGLRQAPDWVRSTVDGIGI
jgi:7-keto-8-aminopelargonate synthetase-like enzyme